MAKMVTTVKHDECSGDTSVVVYDGQARSLLYCEEKEFTLDTPFGSGERLLMAAFRHILLNETLEGFEPPVFIHPALRRK